MKIILLNGPPGCGKDFAAQGLLLDDEPDDRVVVKFAGILKERAHALYGFPGRPHDYYEDCKEDPHPDFLGLTPRKVYQEVSERYFKPLHGENVFGRLLASEIDAQHWNNVFLVSDSGFVEEAQELINQFGAENVALVRIHREGKSFDGDTRSYIEIPDVESFDVVNNGDDSFVPLLKNILNL